LLDGLGTLNSKWGVGATTRAWYSLQSLNQFMTALNETAELATQFTMNAVNCLRRIQLFVNAVSCDVMLPDSVIRNCRVGCELLTMAWVITKLTKCVDEKAEVPQTLGGYTKAIEGQGAGESRRAMVTERNQRGATTQDLSVTMQGVSMDHYTDSVFQPIATLVVLAAVFCLQWIDILGRVVRRRGFHARCNVRNRPLGVAHPFHALHILLALVVSALSLLPLVRAASAALVAATSALRDANIAHNAILVSVQVEATTTAAATLVNTYVCPHDMSTFRT